MKTLKRIAAVVVFVMLAGSLAAQTIGLKAGYTLSDMLIEEDGDIITENLDMRSGFHVGPSFEWGIGDGAGIETALLITTKGIKLDESGTFEGITYNSSSKVNLWYLDIPVFGKLYADINNSRIYGMIGPYFGVGLTGKTKMEESVGGMSDEEEMDIVWGPDNDDDLKRLGMGLAVGGGAEFNSLLFEFSAHFGLNNISPQTDYDMVVRNRSFMFSVGYKFHK